MLKMSSHDLNRTTRLIHERSGIILGNYKEDMTARNLNVRAKQLGVSQICHYLDYLEKNKSDPEWSSFIKIFTINHTAFFREKYHFQILTEFVKDRKKPITIWSSACSTGEEAYSIAITLQEAIQTAHSGIEVIATDIDTEAIEHAKAGIYTADRVQPVPQSLLGKNFQRGIGSLEGKVRVKSNLRQLVTFDVANLVSGEGWPTGKLIDAVFCRNVMIYFDQLTQERVLTRFAQVIKPGGLLFVGHSENLTQITSDFKLLRQTVYERV